MAKILYSLGMPCNSLLYIIIFMRSLSYVGHPLCTLLLDFITVASPPSG